VRNLASEVNACKNLIDELKDLLERKTEQAPRPSLAYLYP
jgi:hypothetical protein